MRISYMGVLALALGSADCIIAGEASTEVFQVAWEKATQPGAKWTTSGTVITSPNGQRTFLGGITDEAATSLTLENLPEHKVLTLEVELFIVGTWDGSNSRWGPDKLNISLEDRFVFMNTTFSNCMANDWTGTQHYPEDMTGAGGYNCFTGISQIGELGYRQKWARYEPVQEVPIDPFVG